MKLNLLFIPLILLSCSRQKKDNEKSQSFVNQTKPGPIEILDAEVLEIFTDSLNIGEKGRCKVEIIRHRVLEDNYVIVKFYTKGPEHWYIENTYLYESDGLGLSPQLSDFNNDSFNDITFISATAARAANQVRRLFIYDDEEKKLVSMVNSERFPNMLYNDELDCIDAFSVSGGCATHFLKIVGDSLKEFATVGSSFEYGITVEEWDKNGKRKIVLEDTTQKSGYIRFKNFKPLKEYDDY